VADGLVGERLAEENHMFVRRKMTGMVWILGLLCTIVFGYAAGCGPTKKATGEDKYLVRIFWAGDVPMLCPETIYLTDTSMAIGKETPFNTVCVLTRKEMQVFLRIVDDLGPYTDIYPDFIGYCVAIESPSGVRWTVIDNSPDGMAKLVKMEDALPYAKRQDLLCISTYLRGIILPL